MATQLTAPIDVTPIPAAATPTPAVPPADDSLGIDRAFVLSMARVPLIAVAWVAVAALAHLAWATVAPGTTNFGPMLVLAGGMILAAVIDGWAFKVPNWVTLSLVVSGWYIGLMHDCGVQLVPGFTVQVTADSVAQHSGGFGAALLGTALGFALLFPILFIQGMGQGDVKMQMGFGSWCGALFGIGVGTSVLLWAFCVGTLVGGVFGLVMMAVRRQFGKNKENFAAIFGDLQTLVSQGATKAAARANARRPDWVRLPYGVPLCVGFLGYLGYRFLLVA
jgi:prepilin peptidase CpaA